MTKLVFVTQQVDREHPTLGAAAAMVGALASRVDELVVLASRAVPEALPGNARFHSFAAPTQALRGARFEGALAFELARGRPLAVVAHMSPIYAVLAAPLARPLGVRVLLWFTHWRASRLLHLAERVSSAVLSVHVASFPLASAKVIGAGHCIDVDEFPCSAPRDGAGLRLVSLGRYSPAKGLPAILRAVARVRVEGIDARLAVHGPEPLAADAAHRRELGRLAVELGLGGAASFGDAVSRLEIPRLLASADALVNNMRAGAADKIVVEAAAACRPALSSADGYAALLPRSLRFPCDDDEALARRLAELAALPVDRRGLLGRELRARVEREHSVGHWADAVLAAAGS
ncbi:MAG: colanic acid/amylovoran biosynthesis glycosyltransferase [Actinomycetota bacterium]